MKREWKLFPSPKHFPPSLKKKPLTLHHHRLGGLFSISRVGEVVIRGRGVLCYLVFVGFDRGTEGIGP